MGAQLVATIVTNPYSNTHSKYHQSRTQCDNDVVKIKRAIFCPRVYSNGSRKNPASDLVTIIQ